MHKLTDFEKGVLGQFGQVATTIETMIEQIVKEGGDTTLFSKSLLYAAIELEKKLTGPENTADCLIAMGMELKKTQEEKG